MKKKIAGIILFIIFTAGLISSDYKNSLIKIDAADNTITASQKTLGDFLGQCPKSFFDNLPVNESFILWFEKKYGWDVLSGIALSVSEGNTDSQLWYEKTGSSIHVLWTEYCKSIGLSEGTENLIYKEDDDGCVIIDFIGDINFDSGWGTMLKASQMDNGINDCISQSVQEELKSADIPVLNNEFTYNKNGIALDGKEYTFAAYEENVSKLEIFSADLVNVANNHVYDFGVEGFNDTLITLKNNGYEYVGAGNNLKEASAIKYYIVNGRKIAVVSATQIERYSDYTKAATATEPGVLKIDNSGYVNSVIAKADRNSDYVIVIVHWGTEGNIKYDDEQQGLAEQFVNAGADAIIGGHPHRLQGVSYIDDAPVFYSIGNFWFSNSKLYSTIAQLKIDNNGKLSASMIPCIMEDYTTDIITDQAMYDDFYRYVADLSSGVGFDHDGNMYNKGAGQETDAKGEAFAYSSEQSYRKHAGGFDLIGRKIDIVGNIN